MASSAGGVRVLTRVRPVPPATRAVRLVAAAIALMSLALLATAAWLRPDTSGHGTHTQLGLTACAFFERTGVPCPGCGMTTAFSHTVRGHFATAFYTQPMGFGLALLAGLFTWAGAYEAVTGRPIHNIPRTMGWNLSRLLLAACALAIAAWGWKIVLVLLLHGG